MHKTTLTLSIVIPAYNEEDHLKACLDSIAAQTVAPDEVLVVDNNSTDRTAEIAKAYQFVKVYKESRQGIVFTRDKGFNSAKSEVIGRIDADSRLDPAWVENVKQWFNEHPDCAAVTGNCTFYNFPNKLFRHIHHFGYYTLQRVLTGSHVLWGSNMAMRRGAWADVKDASAHNSHIHEDIELSIHLQDKGHKIMLNDRMKAEVSLRRSDYGPASIFHYLSRWPKTYYSAGRKLDGLLISILLFVVCIFVLPISSVYYLLEKFSK